MKNKYKNLIATLIAWLVVATSSYASSISVHGFADIEGHNAVYYSDSASSGSVSGSCITFDPAYPDFTSSAFSSASQTSNVTPLGFSFAQNFHCTWSPPDTIPYPPRGPLGRAGAGAATDFTVSFLVLAAVDYQLTLYDIHSTGGPFPDAYLESFRLNDLTFSGFGTFSGTLLPGSYSFDASQSFFTYDGLFGAGSASAHGEMTFFAPVQIVGVPDTGSTLALLSFALLGLGCLAVTVK